MDGTLQKAADTTTTLASDVLNRHSRHKAQHQCNWLVQKRLALLPTRKAGRRVNQRCPLRVTCGRRPGKNFLTACSIGRVRSRVRPVGAAGVAAGPNALRGTGPNR
jgi:hypothetical protein